MSNVKQFITPALMMLAIILVGAISVLYLVGAANKTEASVTRFAEYTSTTTAASIIAAGDYTVFTGPGSLGSIVITGAAAGTISIYDATTTNINNRTGNTATSTILEASMPASAAVGVYTFDSLVSRGLVISLTGAVATSTITYRQN